MGTEVAVVQHRGWDVVRLTSAGLSVDVLPGKGGDILSVRWLPLDVDVLWSSPWGLRHRGAVSTWGGSVEALMEGYPGGWQTVFPNGGSPVVERGANWGMHGEAWLAPWDYDVDGDAVVLTTRLVRSPFHLTKRIRVLDDRVVVDETVHNVGGVDVEVMWSHHPAFGAPFLSGACRVETAAGTFVVDDERDEPAGDLVVGARGTWPHVPARSGGTVDVSAISPAGSGVDRFGYLTDLERGWAAVVNDELGLTAELHWDVSVMPHAWFWLEANATPDFPWFGAAYVLGIEPATSYPGQGIAAVREKTGTQLLIRAGESRSATVSLLLRG